MRLDSRQLAQDILRGWRILDVKEHVNDFPCGVPDPEDIEHITSIAFFASIQREEANFVTFSLMFLLTHKVARPRHSVTEFNKVVAFAKPVELSVERVRKLANAVDEKASALAVERRGGQYLITGILPFGRTPSPIRLAEGGGYPRPEAFTVTAQAPGSLMFSRANSVIGRFIAGRFELAQPTPFHPQALGGDLINRISTHDAHRRFGTEYWHWYAASLEHLLRSASGRGHGGTIVWLPREQSAEAERLAELGHGVRSFPSIYEAILEVMNNVIMLNVKHNLLFDDHRDGQQRTDTQTAAECAALSMLVPQCKSKLLTLLNTLAQVACIDGATLMEEFFHPLRFGARLRAEEWRGPVRPGPRRGYTSMREIPRNRFGTRHNSAIDYVAAIPNSIAFVLSQDGPVRAITRRDDAVYIWLDCLSTVFVQ